MPSWPGVLPVIAQAQAGTVIGGVMLARSPYMPLAKIFREVRHLVGEILEQELRGAAVEADDRDPGSLLHAASSRLSWNDATGRGCGGRRPTR